MCRPLASEDYRVQPRAEVSPPWWNLGHTSWFFARNVLCTLGGEYDETDRRLDYLLNSYYVSLGSRLTRASRGQMARPTNDEILEYRLSVERRVERLIETIADDQFPRAVFLIQLGNQHEQQHQELFHTEIKAIYHELPTELRPSYLAAGLAPRVSRPPPQKVRTGETPVARKVSPLPLGEGQGEGRARSGETPVARGPTFTEFSGGLCEIGNVEGGWCWDNELPVHRAYLPDFALADRPVTCGEFLEFVEDGGYRNPLLWLDNAWSIVEEEGWTAPLYWEQRDGRWWLFTLGGMCPLDPDEPVCHVSFYEADAYVRWRRTAAAEMRDVRLPTEQEWEHAARHSRASCDGANLLDAGRLHPASTNDTPAGPKQLLGDVWEWTSSYYQPYPGFQPYAGALAEYNSKFMDNQRIMRGGSCLTPPGHVRLSYRNFWSPQTRFQMTGLRLAKHLA